MLTQNVGAFPGTIDPQKLDNKADGLTEEVRDIFSDPEVNISRVIRELSTCFGPDATIHDVAVAFSDYKLPTKEVNGKHYIAGYKGTSIVPTGLHSATLIDVKSRGTTAKLMFAVHKNKYLFQTLKTFRVEDIVSYAKKIDQQFNIVVVHETIENTGGVHAVIISSESLD